MHSAPRSPLALKLIAVLCLALISSSCSGNRQQLASSAVLARQLPEAPSWSKPLKVLVPPVGTPALDVAKSAIGVAEGNAWRLTCFGRWYEERRVELATGKTAKLTKGCP